MAFEVKKVRRVNANYVIIHYDVWHPNCKPCSLRPKTKLIESKEEITNEQAEQIIKGSNR